MSQKKVAVSAATADELREFAATHLGIEFPKGEGVENMRAQVTAAWDKPHILLGEEEEEAAPPPRTMPKTGKGTARSDEFIVQIQVQETFDGNEPVPLGCNGRMILVPRGRWCAVPEKFRDSLVNAVECRYESNANGGLGAVREVPRYPHQIWTGSGEPAEGVLRPRLQ